MVNNQIRLSTSEIKQVQGQAREKLGECQKGNDVIGVQIFSILSKYARVIYYPLGDGAPWGFTRVKVIGRLLMGRELKEMLICLNIKI